jgi:protein-tyrosine-phosphatase
MEVARLLLEHAADPTIKDPHGKRAADRAERNAKYQVATLLRDERRQLIRASAERPDVVGPPLFVCHANCCRSVLASYLYRHLCTGPALSAGLEPGERLSDRAQNMLTAWGIDASDHRPTKLTDHLCDDAGAIFLMAPSYAHRLLREYGEEHANKTYLFADPFSKPLSFGNGQYVVSDPSFDHRPTNELLNDFTWMRERVLQIRLALLGHGRRLVPAAEYLDVCKRVDPYSH